MQIFKKKAEHPIIIVKFTDKKGMANMHTHSYLN